MPQLYTYKVKEVFRVIDGDTIKASIDIGFSMTMSHTFRLEGYDAPETWRPKTNAEAIAGKKVTTYLSALLDTNAGNLYLRSSKLGIYGRYAAILFYMKNEKLFNINLLIQQYMNDNKLNKSDVRESSVT